MRKIILCLLSFLLLAHTFVTAQPSGYTPGTQVCWTFNGRDHGYFKAAGNGERHILISFTGDGQTNCTNYQGEAPQKFLNDAGDNWDGRTVRAPGDTIVWEVLTINHTSSFYIPAYAADIDYFFTHIASIDTSDHSKFHIEGLSGGVGRFWGYVTNNQGHNSPYRKIFSTTISQSGTTVINMMNEVKPWSEGKRHWVWYGTADANTGTPPSSSIELYDSLRGSKRLTAQLGSGHGFSTWDSCMSLKGSDTLTNRWLWMVRKDTAGPPPCPDYGEGGGPSGYVPNTQVCWNFNGRDHGYFRATGCGERHILISFTGDGGTDCTNYQGESPQKWLEDAGVNWNGKTVRAPGDTILWEVVTIPYNSGYWMPNYANDIAYALEHIVGMDTSDHTKFHIEGFSGGVGRMWGYLANDQSHNSPYRKIFSTTIGIATPWLGNLSAVRQSSATQRHWIWYGTDDDYGPTPPAASIQLYDSLSGYKRLTGQVGGDHSAITWDSCLSLAGSDTNTNRWLWMVTPGGSGARLIVSKPAEVKKVTPPVQAGTLPIDVSAYPNPVTNNRLRIVLNSAPAQAWELTVVDIQGRLLKRIPGIQAQQYSLDVSALGKGIYFAQVRGKGFTKQVRFVKE